MDRDERIKKSLEESAKSDALQKLKELDMRSIRALREGDTVRIKALEDEAKEIRKVLK